MNTREILTTLLEVSKSLEDQSYVREADKVHNLMIRVSQSLYPITPYKTTPPKSILQNLGDAISGGVKSLDKAINQGTQAVGQGAKNLVQSVGKAVTEPIRQREERNRKDELHRNKVNMQYEVQTVEKKLLDEATQALRNNIYLTLDQARQAMKDKLYALPNYRDLYNKHNQAYTGNIGIDRSLVYSFDYHVRPGIYKERQALYKEGKLPQFHIIDANGNLEKVA
jgi:hypothetical protein